MKGVIVQLVYLASAILFIFGLKLLSKVRTARRGNALASLAMLIAIVATLINVDFDPMLIVGGLLLGGAIGLIAARKVAMTAMPEMVAIFNGFGGGASTLVALAFIHSRLTGAPAGAGFAEIVGGAGAVSAMLSVLIGSVTFSGSAIAFAKLQGLMTGNPILFKGQNAFNAVIALGALSVAGWTAFLATGDTTIFAGALVLTAITLVLGVLAVIPIGGADMPVVISLLNSYSGLAACAAGFVVENTLLIVSGALVGASGLILTNIMCKAMNRSLANVLFAGFGAESTTGGGAGAREYSNIKQYGAEDAALIMESAQLVVIVPGYGLAVAQAQHACKELGDLLEKRGCRVIYAVHPVAGRMPGHMNVLLAEADVPYEQLIEMDEVNPEFKNADVALILGANDVVNPAALDEPDSPIWGMPILNVHESRSVMIVKRSLSPGFAGIKNKLFEMDNSFMVFGDAKQVLQDLNNELKNA